MTAAVDKFLEFASKKGLKNTPQRRLIIDVFFSTENHVSTEDLYDLVRKVDGSVGQATVYRTLRLLCEAGLAKEFHFGDGIARYEPTDGDDHHDHLICTQCGKNIEVIDEVIEKNQIKLAARHGFKLISHRMYLYGVCSDCRSGAEKATKKRAQKS